MRHFLLSSADLSPSLLRAREVRAVVYVCVIVYCYCLLLDYCVVFIKCLFIVVMFLCLCSIAIAYLLIVASCARGQSFSACVFIHMGITISPTISSLIRNIEFQKKTLMFTPLVRYVVLFKNQGLPLIV